MEKEGLTRAVDFLLEGNFDIGTLVTDRHKQIAKWVRESLPSTDPRYDMWHLAKGSQYVTIIMIHAKTLFFTHVLVAFRKKLEAVAKEKDCELVGEWVNHTHDIHST